MVYPGKMGKKVGRENRVGRFSCWIGAGEKHVCKFIISFGFRELLLASIGSQYVTLAVLGVSDNELIVIVEALFGGRQEEPLSPPSLTIVPRAAQRNSLSLQSELLFDLPNLTFHQHFPHLVFRR